MTPRTPRHRAPEHPTYAPIPASWAVGMYAQPSTPAQAAPTGYGFECGAL